MRATPGGNRPADPHSIELQSGPPTGQETTSRAASRRHSSSGTVGKSLIKMLNRTGPNIDPLRNAMLYSYGNLTIQFQFSQTDLYLSNNS